MGEKIDINSASAAELEQGLVGVGRRRAQAIVRRRKEIGGFESVEELARVRGIGAWVQEMNHEVLTCRSSSGAGPAPGTERRRRANGLPRRRRDEATGRLQVEEEDDDGDEPDEEEEGVEDDQGDADVEEQQEEEAEEAEEGEGDGLEEEGEHNQVVDDNVSREQNNFKPVPGPAVFGHASAIYHGEEMMDEEEEDDDDGDDEDEEEEEEEEEGGSGESDEVTEGVMPFGRESASSGITFKQALAHVRQQNKINDTKFGAKIRRVRNGMQMKPSRTRSLKMSGSFEAFAHKHCNCVLSVSDRDRWQMPLE
uniref:transcription initiation factor TFIID subunit 11-like isoform X2 n=1 Tax=Myxine glutinosa TaxID=7769 RepID=UPI00358FB70B